MDPTSFVALWSVIAALMTTDATSLPWTAWHLARMVEPAILLCTALAWQHCRASLAPDVASARAWSSRRQVTVALLVTFLAVGPIAFFVLSLAAVAVPLFVTAWTIAVASATSAYGLWIAARLVWQVLHQPTSLFATH